MFVKTRITNEKYFLCNSENLPRPIQMKLSSKLKIISDFFTGFLKSTFNFDHAEQKDVSHSSCLCEVIDCEIRTYVNV